MKKVYYLSSCSTCKRIMDNLDLTGFVKQDIKTEAMTKEQVEEMGKMTGSFESLFSRRAMKYRAMGLNEKVLSEDDYKNLIVEEYTFLKRPVFIVESKIFVGNTKKTVAALVQELSNLAT